MSGLQEVKQLSRAGAERTMNERELERSRSDLFSLAPIIAQFLHYSSLRNDERMAVKNDQIFG